MPHNKIINGKRYATKTQIKMALPSAFPGKTICHIRTPTLHYEVNSFDHLSEIVLIDHQLCLSCFLFSSGLNTSLISNKLIFLLSFQREPHTLCAMTKPRSAD